MTREPPPSYPPLCLLLLCCLAKNVLGVEVLKHQGHRHVLDDLHLEYCGKVVAVFDLYSSGIIALFRWFGFRWVQDHEKPWMTPSAPTIYIRKTLWDQLSWVSKNHLEIAALAGHPTVSHWYSIGPKSHHLTNWKKPPVLTPNHPIFFFGIHLVMSMTNQSYGWKPSIFFSVDGRNPALLGGSSHLVLITMVSKSPDWGCSLYKRPNWLINGGY